MALFEVRPLLYMLLVYMLVTNLLEHRRQYRRLVLMAFAVSIQSIFALVYYRGLPDEERENAGEPDGALGDDPHERLVMFLLTLVLLHCSRSSRWLLLILRHRSCTPTCSRSGGRR